MFDFTTFYSPLKVYERTVDAHYSQHVSDVHPLGQDWMPRNRWVLNKIHSPSFYQIKTDGHFGYSKILPSGFPNDFPN